MSAQTQRQRKLARKPECNDTGLVATQCYLNCINIPAERLKKHRT